MILRSFEAESFLAPASTMDACWPSNASRGKAIWKTHSLGQWEKSKAKALIPSRISEA